MTKILSGTMEEIIREVFVQRIPLSTKAHVELEIPAGSEKTDVPKRTPEERLRAFQEWVASHRDITAVVLDDSRAAIYAEDEDRG